MLLTALEYAFNCFFNTNKYNVTYELRYKDEYIKIEDVKYTLTREVTPHFELGKFTIGKSARGKLSCSGTFVSTDYNITYHNKHYTMRATKLNTGEILELPEVYVLSGPSGYSIADSKYLVFSYISLIRKTGIILYDKTPEVK